MGRYKFRLSDMMPNSWFYKLKDTSRAAATTTTKHPSTRLLNNPKPTPTPTTKNQQSNSNSNSNSNSFPQTNQLYIPNRPSYYISSNRPQTEHLPTSPARPKASDTHFPLAPPRKSKKTHRRCDRRNSNNSTSSASTPNDIIIDMKSLPPIHTKPAKKKEADQLDRKQIMLRRRRAQQGLHRIKVRPCSTPKAEVKTSRKSSRRLAESVVIVKKSADPKRDFKESMVEMIVEYHIRGPKDLEELLACYLSLNSDEYHGLIVKVFEEIWIDLVKQ